MLGLVKTDSAEDDLYSISWGESSLTATDKLFFLSVQELADYVGNYDAVPQPENGCNEHIVERE